MVKYTQASFFIALYVLVFFPATILIHILSIPIGIIGSIGSLLTFILPLAITVLIARKKGCISSQSYKLANLSRAILWLSLGHLGIISAVLIAMLMTPGGASGIFLLPSIIWSLLFYGIGFSATTKALKKNADSLGSTVVT